MKKYNLVKIICNPFPAIYSDYNILNMTHEYIKI